MWASEKQQCQAILELLRRVRLDDLWTETGPTSEALDLLERDCGPMSHGEAIMLRIAFDLWNGGGKATLAELLSVLDGKNLFAVGSLLVELSNSTPDVDAWIEDLGARDELARNARCGALIIAKAEGKAP